MSLQLIISGPALREPMHVLITQPRITIGRASSCDVRLPFPIVSSHHLTLERDALGMYQLTDMGSTNGTHLNGQRLNPNQPIKLSARAELSILDMRIAIEPTEQQLEQGFTLAESGTMVRQMVSQALQQAEQNADQAFFEVIRGKDRGRRFMIPDDLEQGKIGHAHDALVNLSEQLPAHVATLKRQGDGFLIEPTGQAPVSLGGAPLTAKTPLRSRQRLVIGEVECLFFDPLQEYLEDLEYGSEAPSREPERAPGDHGTIPGASPTTSAAAPTETTAPESLALPSTPSTPKASAATDSLELTPSQGATAAPKAKAAKGWSVVEVFMLVMTVLFILGGVGILVMFLGA